MTKPGFTLEQHKDIGQKLGLIKDELGQIIIKISKAYPKETTYRLHRAIELINLTRSKLDDKLAEEHPELTTAEFNSIYYGTRGEKTRENESASSSREESFDSSHP